MKALFEGMCPNCRGEISDERLRYGLPCEKCLPNAAGLISLRDQLSPAQFHVAVANALKQFGTYAEYDSVVKMDELSASFSQFFEKITGEKPYKEQVSWAVRVLSGESFALVAPPGVGKSVFSEVMALFLALRGKHVIFLTPTTLLASQVSKRLREFSSGLGVSIAEFTSSALKLERGSPKDSIVVVTSNGLRVHFQELIGSRFDIAFVDDVDAILRSSKNLERLLQLIGYKHEDLQLASKIAFGRLNAMKLARRDPESAKRTLIEIDKLMSSVPHLTAQVVLTSATARAKGKGAVLLDVLLGMNVEGGLGGTRNVVDVKIRGDLMEEPIKEIQRLGAGGLIFVSHDLGSRFAKDLYAKMKERGLPVELAEGKRSVKLVQELERGKIWALIGLASYYGPLVRGLDLPAAVRYAVFVGVPKFMFKISGDETNPVRIYQLLWELGTALNDSQARKLASELRRMIRPLSQEEFKALEKNVKNMGHGTEHKTEDKKDEKQQYMQRVLDKVNQARERLSILLNREGAVEALKKSERLIVREKGGSLYLLVPDLMTYLQASGRTSRIGREGFTTGLSEVIVDDEAVMDALERQAKLYIQDIEWREVHQVDWDALAKRMSEERSGGNGLKPLSPALMVVESPNKARTISSFFGRSIRKNAGGILAYEVNVGHRPLTIVATGGHLLDLPIPGQGEFGVKEVNGEYLPSFTTIKKCMVCGFTFTEGSSCPACGSSYVRDSYSVIRALRQMASEVDTVYVCTDPDIEGERIAWDVMMVLSPYNKNIVRAAFHEITRNAVLDALSKPRAVDERLTEAQVVRRIDDRWVAFHVAKALAELQGRPLPVATGRVQAPALDWIVERYAERHKYIHVYATLELEPAHVRLVIQLPKELNKKTCKEIFDGSEARVASVFEREEEENPPPPFTTDELLLAASFYLKMGVEETMRTAQELFEAGLITYHRTSSTHISSSGMMLAKTFIEGKWPAEAVSLYRPRSWGPEGAHEAIRPTRPMGEDELRNAVEEGLIRIPFELRWPHYALYSLIFKRFIQSQMAPAYVKRQKFEVEIKPKWDRGEIKSEGEVLVEVVRDGWMRISNLNVHERLKVGDIEKCTVVGCRRGTEPGKGILSEGSLVALMKKRGIGKPSTYASTVERLKRHGYVISSGRMNYLIPTKSGIELDQKLRIAFPSLVSDETTRQLEQLMDGVESGAYSYQEVLRKIHSDVLLGVAQAKAILTEKGYGKPLENG
ncbi:MAG: reverse gyrase [Thermoprotei archaeon]